MTDRGAADRAGASRRARRGVLPADLLPRQLRRHGALARTTSTRPSSPRRARSSSPARISPAPTPRRRRRRRSASPRRNGRKVVFDVDYRPNLWGLLGHAAGDSRYVRSDAVTEHLQPILADCDLIVGTEEELHIAGGSEDTLAGASATSARSSTAHHRAASAARWAAWCFPATFRIRSMTGVEGSGLSRRGLQRARRGRRVPVRLPARLAEGRAAGDMLRLCQCQRRLRGVAPALLAGNSDLPRIAAFPPAWQPPQGAALRRGHQPHPLGDDPPAAGPTR